MILRPASLSDVSALAALASDSFDAAFGHLYDSADLAAFLAEHRSEARYERHLADPATRIALLEPEDGGPPVAFALIVLGRGFEQAPDPRPEAPVALQQLYCAPGHPGQGLGARLMEWVLAEAREYGADAVQLSVFSENYGAQRFYRRHGFAHTADIDFWVGTHRDDEFLYELRFETEGPRVIRTNVG